MIKIFKILKIWFLRLALLKKIIFIKCFCLYEFISSKLFRIYLFQSFDLGPEDIKFYEERMQEYDEFLTQHALELKQLKLKDYLEQFSGFLKEWELAHPDPESLNFLWGDVSLIVIFSIWAVAWLSFQYCVGSALSDPVTASFIVSGSIPWFLQKFYDLFEKNKLKIGFTEAISLLMEFPEGISAQIDDGKRIIKKYNLYKSLSK